MSDDGSGTAVGGLAVVVGAGRGVAVCGCARALLPWSERTDHEEHDGLGPGGNHPGLLMLAASNTEPSLLDGALVRPGRLGHLVGVRRPDHSELVAIWQLYLGPRVGQGEEVKWDKLADLTRGQTPAHVTDYADTAQAHALAFDRVTVTMDDALFAIRRGQNIEPLFESDELHWHIAVHEASHAVAAFLLRGRDWVKTLVASKEKGAGHTVMGVNDTRRLTEIDNRDAQLDRVCALLAGGVGEEFHFGQPCGGGAADMQQAYHAVTWMLNNGFTGPAYDPQAQHSHDALNQVAAADVYKVTMTICESQRERARTLLHGQMDAVVKLAEAARDAGELTGDELTDAFATAGLT